VTFIPSISMSKLKMYIISICSYYFIILTVSKVELLLLYILLF